MSERAQETEATETGYGEVVGFLTDLIRIDTSNPVKPERPAAEYVAEKLAEVGLEPQIFESDPGRASVVARFEGSDPSADALLVHGHLDVVPADAADWSVHPFAGEVKDGLVWGRGAVDMKDMDAMTLAVVRRMLREGRRPRATSSSRSWPTRRPAATTARSSSPTSTRGCSRAAPRRSARSAATPTRSTPSCGCT
jgi:acetylornithine deacetylase/succinyl-diaminopimelate desuccinylase-like protein